MGAGLINNKLSLANILVRPLHVPQLQQHSTQIQIQLRQFALPIVCVQFFPHFDGNLEIIFSLPILTDPAQHQSNK